MGLAGRHRLDNKVGNWLESRRNLEDWITRQGESDGLGARLKKRKGGERERSKSEIAIAN